MVTTLFRKRWVEVQYQALPQITDKQLMNALHSIIANWHTRRRHVLSRGKQIITVHNKFIYDVHRMQYGINYEHIMQGIYVRCGWFRTGHRGYHLCRWINKQHGQKADSKTIDWCMYVKMIHIYDWYVYDSTFHFFSVTFPWFRNSAMLVTQ